LLIQLIEHFCPPIAPSGVRAGTRSHRGVAA
jgi:hypothetical protein